MLCAAIAAALLGCAACAGAHQPSSTSVPPVTDIGIGIGTSVGLAVVAPACGQVGSDITATGTVVNDGPMQGDKIALLLTVLGEDGSLHISSATYRFPDVANALVAYRMTATTQVQRALACDVDVVWGRPAT